MKAIMTISDNAKGQVDVNVEFEPALTNETQYSPALQLAMDLVQHSVRLSRKEVE